ncbi:MAG: GNAT family N-acetyltransferase [Anaerolineae bacterium]|nr:GNAT family N-acetyltransferase [Anaerolineae bacterium]
MPEIILRDVMEADLPIFFEQQRDAAALHMAAFTSNDPHNWEAFLVHWTKIMADPTVVNKTILFQGQVVGNIATFIMFDEPSVAYGLGREYWGQGLATEALRQFLELVTTRPLFARAAKDNLGSLRVLQKCGFVISGEDKGFANARGVEIEEYILRLDIVPK